MKDKRFSINLYCDNVLDRPKASYKVVEYIETFIYDNILLEKKIIIKSKWNVVLGISFLERDYNQKTITVLPPNIFSELNAKQYVVIAPYKNRLSKGNLSVEFGLYLFEIASVFFTEYFKKIKIEELEKMKYLLDIDYLSGIKYPAEFSDQKYIDD